jgi:hypothetical protein
VRNASPVERNNSIRLVSEQLVPRTSPSNNAPVAPPTATAEALPPPPPVETVEIGAPADEERKAWEFNGGICGASERGGVRNWARNVAREGPGSPTPRKCPKQLKRTGGGGDACDNRASRINLLFGEELALVELIRGALESERNAALVEIDFEARNDCALEVHDARPSAVNLLPTDFKRRRACLDEIVGLFDGGGGRHFERSAGRRAEWEWAGGVIARRKAKAMVSTLDSRTSRRATDTSTTYLCNGRACMSAGTADVALSTWGAPESAGSAAIARQCKIHGAPAKMHAPIYHNSRELCNAQTHFE